MRDEQDPVRTGTGEAARRVGRGLIVDLANGCAQTSAVRRGAHLEPAGLQHGQRCRRGGVESHAAPDHLSIAVLDHQPDAVQRCGLSTERRTRARTGNAQPGPDAGPQQSRRERHPDEDSNHAGLMRDACVERPERQRPQRWLPPGQPPDRPTRSETRRLRLELSTVGAACWPTGSAPPAWPGRCRLATATGLRQLPALPRSAR